MNKEAQPPPYSCNHFNLYAQNLNVSVAWKVVPN